MRRALALSVVVSICLAAAPAGAANVWTSIGPDGGQILALEADTQKPGVLYAGTGQGVFKSTDGGTTWLRSSQGLMRRGVYDVAVAADSSVVYTSGEGGIFVSRDAGATWSGPRLHSAYTTSVAVDPHNARRVWASNINFLYRSDDAGATWSALNPGIDITHARDIAVDPFRPDTLYAVSVAVEGYGVTQVIKSTDAGKTWVRLGGGLEPSSDESSAQLAVDPTTPDLLYVSFDDLPPGAARMAAPRGTAPRVAIRSRWIARAWSTPATCSAPTTARPGREPRRCLHPRCATRRATERSGQGRPASGSSAAVIAPRRGNRRGAACTPRR